jgi:hypothetical protein
MLFFRHEISPKYEKKRLKNDFFVTIFSFFKFEFFNNFQEFFLLPHLDIDFSLVALFTIVFLLFSQALRTCCCLMKNPS